MNDTALDDSPAAPAMRDANRGQADGGLADRVVLVYTTFPSKGDAKKAGRELVEKGLAACVNIFPKMTSIYEWKGEIEESREAAMLIKTARTRSEAVLAEVKRLHPYSLPARLVLAVDGGGNDFLEWICNQTHDTAP